MWPTMFCVMTDMAYNETGQRDDARGFVFDLLFHTEDMYFERYEAGERC